MPARQLRLQKVLTLTPYICTEHSCHRCNVIWLVPGPMARQQLRARVTVERWPRGQSMSSRVRPTGIQNSAQPCICFVHDCMHAKSLQSCLTLCSPMDCSLPGSLGHGIHQARIREQSATSSSRGTSRPRDQTHVSYFYLQWQVGSLPPGRPYLLCSPG